jgi:hypothetical protein
MTCLDTLHYIFLRLGNALEHLDMKDLALEALLRLLGHEQNWLR